MTLKNEKGYLKTCELFGNTFIFIDDLIAINEGLFEKSYTGIHLPELELKKEDKNNK